MKRCIALALLAALLLPRARARAERPSALRMLSATVEVDGGSTLHAWVAASSGVTISTQLGSGSEGLFDRAAHRGLAGLDWGLGAASLKSTEGSSMDANIRKALDTDKFPFIRFKLGSYALAGATVTAKGDLSIHGRTKPVTLTGLLTVKDGRMDVSGSYPLLMSDYGIKPPVMMLGTIRVADKVKIRYDFKLSE